MRYSRIKKRQSKQKYVIIIVIGLLLFAGVYIFTIGAAGKFISGIVAPILKTGDKSDKESEENNNVVNNQETELSLDKDGENNKDENIEEDNGQEAEKTVDKITESLDVKEFNTYIVQMGAFSKKENADTRAKEIQNQGGAGYVVEDEFFRVLAMAFKSKSDAEQVKEQLKQDGIESRIYEIPCPGVSMEITATKEKVSGIKTSFLSYKDIITSFEDLIVQLDTGKITVNTAGDKLKEVISKMKNEIEKLENYSADNGTNKILQNLNQLYKDSSKKLEEICNKNTSDRVEFSSKMKYTYIDSIYRYKQFMTDITKV